MKSNTEIIGYTQIVLVRNGKGQLAKIKKNDLIEDKLK